MADPDLRLYGQADPSNRQDAADNGLRGEGATDAANLSYRHDVVLPGGRTVTVEETSGTAFVDANQPSRTAAGASAPPPSPSAWPWIVVSLALGYMLGRRLRTRAPVAPLPAALTRTAGEPGSFTQVRDAGPLEVRDPPAGWSAVDEASDESFPASDPPSYSIPGR